MSSERTHELALELALLDSLTGLLVCRMRLTWHVLQYKKVSGGAFLSSRIIAVIAGTVASRYAYIAIIPLVVDGAVGVALSFFGAAIVGVAVGIVVELIIAAIDGARERGELEGEKAKLQEAIDKIAPTASALQIEVAKVCAAIFQVMAKQPRTASF